jgi:molecular chaperone DnaK
MKKDAEMNDADDKKKKDEVEVRNLAEQLIYTAEKAVKDNKDKVSAEIITAVEAKIADLKKAKEGTDIAVIKTATEALSTEMSKIGEAMSKGGATEAPKTEGDGKVHDAEAK